MHHIFLYYTIFTLISCLRVQNQNTCPSKKKVEKYETSDTQWSNLSYFYAVANDFILYVCIENKTCIK